MRIPCRTRIGGMARFCLTCVRMTTQKVRNLNLGEQDYPQSDIRMGDLEEALLRFSNAIRLPDDLTLVEVRFA